MGGSFVIEADTLPAFAEASGDRNPLHASSEYSRSTPWGMPVVYGILGSLQALATTGAEFDAGAGCLVLDWRRPMFAGVAYNTEVSPVSGVITVVDDGEMCAAIRAQPHTDIRGPDRPAGATTPMRREAADLAHPFEHVGRTVTGSYACDPVAIRRLLTHGARLRLDDLRISGVAWVSYVAGMELPGRQAMLTGADIRFREGVNGPPFTFSATLTDLDERFGLATVDANLWGSAGLIATARIRALVRPRPAGIDWQRVHSAPMEGIHFAGQRAVVVGGSRGIGGHLVALLARGGAEVVFTHRSGAPEILTGLADAGLRATPIAGDAGDAATAQSLVSHVADGIDFVAVCAWPPLIRMPVGPNAVARGVDHVATGLAMTAVPLTALLPKMKPGGAVLVLSSDYVTEPTAAVWHYAAGKAALEGACRAFAARYPHVRFILARPGRVSTDYVQTTVGRSLEPADAAAALLRLVPSRSRPGVHVVRGPSADDPRDENEN
ncbi:MAG: SDR family NAD(P)-dependent oxidoreductase [Actinomycetota bacterium]|nr:SDR family NAD(P)-dependent oxidoreductase [Actinomycetota bacterium]